MNRRYRDLTLRWRLSLLVSMVALFTATGISLAVYALWTEQIRLQVGERLQQGTELAAKGIERELHYELTNLRAWTQLDVMVDIISDDVDKRIITTLNLLKKNYHLSGELILFNDDGRVVASTGADMPEMEQYALSFAFPASLAPDSQLYFKSPVTLPVLADQRVGYLVLTHPWGEIVGHLSEALDEFLIQAPGSNGHFHRSRLQQGSGVESLGVGDAQWQLNGQTKLHSAAVQLLPELSPEVFIYGVADRSTALQPVKQALLLILVVTGLLLLPVVLVAVWSAVRFVRPITELQTFAEGIVRTGDLRCDFPVHGRDEVGKLARVLKQMTENLREAFGKNEQINQELMQLTETLEQRVEARTEELSQALTRLKETQSQLVQSEKMVSLGQLVAGIAHELNNPISSIYANIPILKEYLSELLELVETLSEQGKMSEQALKQRLDEMDYEFLREDVFTLLKGQADAAQRIRDIVLSLRNFSRLDEQELKQVDLNESIDNTLNILRHEFKHRITVHKDYRLSQPVECFAGEINQVVMNILVNASQAIEGDGHIRISTALTAENQALIEIQDDGPGIPDAILNKIFDPFFTTKPVGEGTGLGLSISYGIIEKHHGSIRIDNVVPHGARFRIRLPLTQDTSDAS